MDISQKQINLCTYLPFEFILTKIRQFEVAWAQILDGSADQTNKLYIFKN